MNAHLWVVDKKDPVNVLKCLGLYCVKIQFNDMNERSYTLENSNLQLDLKVDVAFQRLDLGHPDDGGQSITNT